MSHKYLLLTAALGFVSARADALFVGDINDMQRATEEAYSNSEFLKAQVVSDCAQQNEKKAKGEPTAEEDTRTDNSQQSLLETPEAKLYGALVKHDLEAVKEFLLSDDE